MVCSESGGGRTLLVCYENFILNYLERYLENYSLSQLLFGLVVYLTAMRNISLVLLFRGLLGTSLIVLEFLCDTMETVTLFWVSVF